MNATRPVLFASMLLLSPAPGGAAPEPECEATRQFVTLPLTMPPPQMHVAGDALAHMIGGVGVPAAPLDMVSVEWSSGTVGLPDGEAIPISLSVRFRPGAGLPLDDGTHLVILEALGGELTVPGERSPVSWQLEPGNYSDFFAKSQHNPASPHGGLGLHLPVLLRNAQSNATVSAHLLLGFGYDAEAKSLIWRSGQIWSLLGHSSAARGSGDALVAMFTNSARTKAPDSVARKHERALQVRANHATMLAHFKYGDGLQRLTSAQPYSMPGCTDDPDVLEVEFLGTTSDDRLTMIRLEVMPGSSWAAGAGVQSQVIGIGGSLTIGEAPASTVWRISSGNRGSTMPDTRYDPATGALTFLLAVALEDAAGESILADVELRCGMQADALTCDEVLVDELAADRRGY